MKTSDKLLTGLIVLVFVGTAAAMFIAHSTIKTKVPTMAAVEFVQSDTTAILNVRDFSMLSAVGAWQIDAAMDTGYRLIVTGDSGTLRNLRVYVLNDTLIVVDDNKGGEKHRNVRMTLRCPRLTHVSMGVATAITLDGFTTERLVVVQAGACRVSAMNMTLQSLDLLSAGT